MLKYSKMCILILFLFIVCEVHAAQVIPSSRVSNHVNIRENPDKNSSIIAKLEKNKSAELMESVPYWYKIKTDTEITGYVSKAWTDIIDSAQDKGQIIRLGSWNIKKLGHGQNKDYDKVVEVIEKNFDILVIIEVMQKQRTHGGYDKLIEKLGDDWSGLVTDTPRPNTGDGHSEFYAIVYRNDLIKTCQGWDTLVYHEDNNGSGNDRGDDHFSREPAFGCFEAPLNDVVNIDFLLAAYHATFKSPAEIKAEARRLNEVFESMKESRPGEKDLLIAGDFNLIPDKLRNEIPFSVTTLGSGSTINSSGEVTTNVYDHIISNSVIAEQIDTPQIINVMSVSVDGKSFYTHVSDHLPVLISLRATGPDDD